MHGRGSTTIAMMLACAMVFGASHARAEPAEATIPIRVETDGDPIRVDEELCRRGPCEMRVTPGRHRVSREVLKDGAWVSAFETEVEVVAPTVLRVEGPGLLRRTAFVTLVAGATLVVGGGIVAPLLACRSTTVTDLNGMQRLSNPCDGLSDEVKIGWVAGVGVGLTLVMLGIVGYALTPGTSRVGSRTWALHPIVAPSRAGGVPVGLGFTATF